MKAASETHRKGLTPIKAAVILVVAIVAVGTVGYVVLSAIGTGGTSHTSSCAPSKAPQCTGTARASEVFSSSPATAALRG
ncbi:MAG: hypothetical protein ABSA63_03885 [Thermoplasmata archaeon]|jgi:hypothetical protein